jgi:hypothetical protein
MACQYSCACMHTCIYACLYIIYIYKHKYTHSHVHIHRLTDHSAITSSGKSIHKKALAHTHKHKHTHTNSRLTNHSAITNSGQYIRRPSTLREDLDWFLIEVLKIPRIITHIDSYLPQAVKLRSLATYTYTIIRTVFIIILRIISHILCWSSRTLKSSKLAIRMTFRRLQFGVALIVYMIYGDPEYDLYRSWYGTILVYALFMCIVCVTLSLLVYVLQYMRKPHVFRRASDAIKIDQNRAGTRRVVDKNDKHSIREANLVSNGQDRNKKLAYSSHSKSRHQVQANSGNSDLDSSNFDTSKSRNNNNNNKKTDVNGRGNGYDSNQDDRYASERPHTGPPRSPDLKPIVVQRKDFSVRNIQVSTQVCILG